MQLSHKLCYCYSVWNITLNILNVAITRLHCWPSTVSEEVLFGLAVDVTVTSIAGYTSNAVCLPVGCGYSYGGLDSSTALTR